MAEPTAVAIRFNDAVNARDLAQLTDLMTDDHRFIDPADTVVTGKEACVDAWRGFFTAFPTYRNIWETVRPNDSGVVVIGHSVCPGHPELDGPALWTIVLDSAGVAEWRVHPDTPETRQRLGLT